MKRTAAYEAYADALRHDDEPEEILSQRAWELGRDYRKRLKRWESTLDPDYAKGDAPDEWLGLAGLIGDSIVTVGGGLLLALIIAAILIATAWIWITLLLAWLLLVAAIYLARLNLRQRLRSAMRERQCPDCRHDLRAAHPEIAPDDLDGADAGPAACSRCGAPWPMLPPGLS